MNIKFQALSDVVFHQFLGLLRFSRQYARQIMAEQGIKPRQFSVLRYLLDSGLLLARLETGIRQPEALGLYRASGYREIGPFGDYGPDPLSVFMEKNLATLLGASPAESDAPRDGTT